MSESDESETSRRPIPGNSNDPVPVVVMEPPARPKKRKPPQTVIDQFWSQFVTKVPGKATSVIPQKSSASKALRRLTKAAGGQTVGLSYDEAASQCRAKVAQIVKECRRVNQKYRDPHFDLELDLKLNRGDCLESLSNVRPEPSTAGSSTSLGFQTRQPRRWRQQQQQQQQQHRQTALSLSESDCDDASFNPKSVKRVPDIFDKPKFYIDGPTANDVRQGRDGDCWFLAGLCTLSNKPGLIERTCVAHDQVVGVYGFVFHRDGEWFSEIIDDKLYLTKPDYDENSKERDLFEDRRRTDPDENYRKMYQSNSGALYFAQCENPNETWLPLLEKAFAKAHGDYASIEGGFTGEAIEDMTGGVTSEIYTTDILDKEYFWKEELLKVNELFLFGCSTGMWGRGFGERRGIVEQHAYSVMRAVEMDGQRLVLLKNPWGSHEWKGAWSDGSEQWTAEWIQKLGHRFGDDGSFWISYDDLLCKYQSFDRTRLFGDDWRMASIWTTMTVPWTLEYNTTKFAFTLARTGPVVLVLSQLDERYFCGLEGQYSFDLSLRLHKLPAGRRGGESDDDSDDSDDDSDAFDYVVRGQAGYRMSRSVSVELELDAGSYVVLVKIDAERNRGVMPPEEVVRFYAKTRREKLIRIGRAYDLAHSKGQVVETAAEKEARKAAAARQKQRGLRKLKKDMMEHRKLMHLGRQLDVKMKRKQIQKKKARQAAKEARQLEKQKKAEAEAEEARQLERQKKAEAEAKERQEKRNEENKAADVKKEEAKEAAGKETAAKETAAKETATKETEEAEAKETKEAETEEAKGPEVDKPSETKEAETKEMEEVDGKDQGLEQQFSKKESVRDLFGATEVTRTTEAAKNIPATEGSGESGSSTDTHQNTPSASASPASVTVEKTAGDSDKAPETIPEKNLDPTPEAATQTAPETAQAVPEQAPEKASETTPETTPETTSAAATQDTATQTEAKPAGRPSIVLDEASDKALDDDRPESRAGRSSRVHSRSRSRSREHSLAPPGNASDAEGPRHHSGSNLQSFDRAPWDGHMNGHMNGRRMSPPPPPPGQWDNQRPDRDREESSEAESDIESLPSLSDISDRSVEFVYGKNSREAKQAAPDTDDDACSDAADSDAEDPWNAMVVVGLRVYYQKVAGDEKRKAGDDDIVVMRVERPLPSDTSSESSSSKDEDEDEDEDEERDGGGGGEAKQDKRSAKNSKDGKKDVLRKESVLDVDDSLRDAAVLMRSKHRKR